MVRAETRDQVNAGIRGCARDAMEKGRPEIALITKEGGGDAVGTTITIKTTNAPTFSKAATRELEQHLVFQERMAGYVLYGIDVLARPANVAIEMHVVSSS